MSTFLKLSLGLLFILMGGAEFVAWEAETSMKGMVFIFLMWIGFIGCKYPDYILRKSDIGWLQVNGDSKAFMFALAMFMFVIYYSIRHHWF